MKGAQYKRSPTIEAKFTVPHPFRAETQSEAALTTARYAKRPTTEGSGACVRSGAPSATSTPYTASFSRLYTALSVVTQAPTKNENASTSSGVKKSYTTRAAYAVISTMADPSTMRIFDWTALLPMRHAPMSTRTAPSPRPSAIRPTGPIQLCTKA